MDRLWRSLLMMVASSSAFFRSVLPPNGSSIDADWSSRKMKHPGFLRLISALYMLAPFLRLFLLRLARLDLGGPDHLGGRSRGLGGARKSALRLGYGRYRLQDCGKRQRGAVPEEPRRRPAGQAQQDEHHPDVERLERPAQLRAPARRAARRGFPS